MEERLSRYAKEFSKLIQAETVSKYYETDFGKFFKFHELLKSTFPNVFSTMEVEKFDGSLLLKWQGKKSDKPIMFMHHHDVVSATGEWKYPPFSGEIKDGKVWGRGTLDTKGGLYTMLKAAEELICDGFIPENDIYFESSCTEEVEGSGAERIAETLKARGVKLWLCLDEGGLILDNPIGVSKGLYAMAGVGEKGCNALKFIAKSSGGHASSPEKNTPLVRLGKFMAEVENSKIFKAEILPTTAEMLRRFSLNAKGVIKFILKHAKGLSFLLKKVLPKLSGMANALVRTTIVFTEAEGSNGYNVIPEYAYVIGDMRVSHHQGYEKSFSALKRIADKYDVSIEEADKGFDSPISDFNSEQFKLIERAVSEIFDGVITVPYICNGASDGRFMTRICDNVIRFLPFTVSDEQLESIHGVNENVDISCLGKAVDYYKYVMENI